MPIVDGRRRIPAFEHGRAPARLGKWHRMQLNMHHNKHFSIYGLREVAKVSANLDVIREHFGVNKTDALRIALHLVARTITRGGMRVSTR